MTGFAARTTEFAPYELEWELRSVNHRFLDLSFRLPEELKRVEGLLRETAARYLRRGKVDCTLRIKAAAPEAESLEIDPFALETLGDLERRVLAAFPEASQLSVNEILRFNGVVKEPDRSLAHADAAVAAGFEAAAAALAEARRNEGERIAGFLGQRVAAIDAAVEQARPLAAEVEQRYRSKLLERIERLEQQPQTDRLEQELAFIAQRMDIAEELDRLTSHTAEIRDVLARDEAIGRRLDFLIQELNREANTMSSKSQDEALTRIAVDLKVVIEQMREQVQNLE
jgi:uncharacterized protein (TIGR00255 family)